METCFGEYLTDPVYKIPISKTFGMSRIQNIFRKFRNLSVKGFRSLKMFALQHNEFYYYLYNYHL